VGAAFITVIVYSSTMFLFLDTVCVCVCLCVCVSVFRCACVHKFVCGHILIRQHKSRQTHLRLISLEVIREQRFEDGGGKLIKIHG